jgi:adenosylhomocysteine nucleosidase
VRILVTFALENEFAPWRKLGKFRRISTDSQSKTYSTQIRSADVRVVLTGVGRFAVQRALAHAFSERVDVCVASGLAGSVKSAYAPGDVLAARAIFEIGGSHTVKSDDDLVEIAERSGAKVVENFLVSERVIATAQEKQRLGSIGDAVDMEGIHILLAAAQRGIRSIAIRAISDGVDADLPLDFSGVFDQNGEVSIGRIVGRLVAKPRGLPGLIRLAHDSQRAASALANVLDAFVQLLSMSPLPENAKAVAVAL